ncbi:hypothetical protein JCM8547_003334 [Rhodosporidiobolus lusitaniae]
MSAGPSSSSYSGQATSKASSSSPAPPRSAIPHRQTLVRGPSLLTGSPSGSATPSTTYGSFPPSDAPAPAAGDVETILRRKLSQNEVGGGRSPSRERRWERSRERLLRPGRDGKQSEDVYDSDGDATASDGEGDALASSGELPPGGAGGGEEEDAVWNAGDAERAAWGTAGSVRSKMSTRSRVEPEGDKQWGVVKMELMSRTWGRRGLFTIYAGVYLISTLTSLEGNTTPTIEPYFLSLLGEHSMLSSVVIVMSIGYAVGKPPMTKILDVFGRAEGICLAATLYSLGYLLTAAATDVRLYIFARALSALGGQGIQLAQQIIVADTTTLANRGLITSTVSLPWLVTTWIGPPLATLFLRAGPSGYRAAYAAFGVLLPLVATVLFCTLYLEWRKIRNKALREGRTPSTRDLGFGVATRASWMGSHHHHHHRPATVSASSSPRKERNAIPSSFRNSLDSARSLPNLNFSHPHPYSSSPHASQTHNEHGEELTEREQVEVQTATAAAHELNKRKRWNKTGWDKTRELWKDMDMVGLASLTVGAAMFLLPFTLATKRPESWEDPLIWLLILSGAAILVFFGWYESRVAVIPLLPPRLLRNRTIVGGSLMGFFHFCSQYCYESFFTSFLQVARNHSAQDASYISQTYIFSACVAAIVAGSLAKLTNRYKWIGVVGVLVHALGVWLMMRSRDLNGTTFELVLSQIIGGVGGGFTTIALQTGCQSVVSHQDVAIATAIFLTITQIGGAVGGSIAGAVWSTTLPSRLKHHLPLSEHHHIEQIIASLPYALSFPMDSAIRVAINKAYVDVQKVLNWLAMSMLVPALGSMLAMKNVNLKKEDESRAPEGVVVLGRASFLAVEEDLSSSSERSSLLGNTSERD